MRRSNPPSSGLDGMMTSEDVGFALASIVMAVGVSWHGVASRSTEDWLAAIGEEVGRAIDAMDVLPGAPPPGIAALQVVLGMISASDPRRAAPGLCAGDAPMSVTRAVCDVAKRSWPKQTAKHLAKHAGVQVRAAEHWLATGAGISSDALAQLLRSDVGGEVLHAVMGDAQPAWWGSFRQAQQNALIRQKLDDLRAEIDEVRRELG